MIEKLKKDIIYKILSLYMKLIRKKEIIDIKNSFIESKKILILLPPSKEQLEIALSFLPKLKKIFKGRKMIYVLPESLKEIFNSNFHGKSLLYQEKDISFFLLPRKKIIRLLKKENVDITICLNPDFDLFCAYTCLRSEAKLRVGLYDKKWEDYFNFQVKKENDNLLGEKYNCLVKYLNMIVKTA